MPTTSSAPDLPAATATASASAPPRPSTLQLRQTSSATSPRPIARVSTQDRLDGILKLGLQRAESMSPGQSPPAFLRRSVSGANNSNTFSPSTEAFRERGEDEPQDEPTETTGIVMRGPNSAPSMMNYQSMAESTGTRSRKPGILKGTSDSRSNGRKSNGAETATRTASNGAGDGAQNGSGLAGSKEKQAWWRAQLDRFGSIELENKGSVARDHLALERTFLAWLRTSLSFASIGVAITQLFRLNTSLSDDDGNSLNRGSQHTLRHLGKPLGAIFLGISILMLFLGYQRYFQAQNWIIKGKFPASRGTIILVSLVALVLMVISLVVVIIVQPGTSSG